MTSGWAAALVGLATLAGVIAGRVWNGGQRSGKIDALMERLIELAEDHEDRLRLLERRPARISHSHRRR